MARMENNGAVARTQPRWLADFIDPQRNQAHYPAKLDISQFTDRDAFRVTLTAEALATATSLTITAVTFPFGVTKIPAGTTLYFGGAKVATLSADYTGGTTMAVNAIPTTIASGDYATYKPFGNRVVIASGTLIGRTYAERDAGTPFGPLASGDEEFGPLLYEINGSLDGGSPYVNCELLRAKHGVTLKQNYLPEWATIDGSALETLLLTGFTLIVGKD